MTPLSRVLARGAAAWLSGVLVVRVYQETARAERRNEAVRAEGRELARRSTDAIELGGRVTQVHRAHCGHCRRLGGRPCPELQHLVVTVADFIRTRPGSRIPTSG